MGRNKSQFKISTSLPVLRGESRLTQEALAEQVGVTRATIIAIERGSYNPSLDLAFRIARFFKVKIDDLFFVEEDRND